MWIIVTLAAVAFQTGRNALSKRLTSEYSDLSASLARFLPGLPLALAALAALSLSGRRIAILDPRFFLWAVLMGLAQLVANLILLALFKRKNFAVSISLVKSETLMLAFLSVLFLGEGIGVWEWIGIALGSAGIMAAALGKAAAPRGLLRGLFSLNTALAFLAGLCLALATLFLKLSYAYVESSSREAVVALALCVVLGSQSLVLALPALLRRRDELASMARKPLLPISVGVLAAAGTFCWFSAFAMAKVSWVRTLGQCEFILACLLSLLAFKERIRPVEIGGMAAVAAGTAMIVLLGS
jgi:drug/metabolite transporter (DMT)-like permease